MILSFETMTAEDLKRELEALSRAGKEIRKTPEATRAFLIKHGFINEKGELTERYRRK